MKKIILISAMAILAIFTTANGNILNQVPIEKTESKAVEYTCPMHPEVISDKPGQCPKCGMDLVKKEVTKVEYTCSMHPEVVTDKPGKCPKCGMNLVKKGGGTSKKEKTMKGCCNMKM
jgi:hypothetical protein